MGFLRKVGIVCAVGALVSVGSAIASDVRRGSSHHAGGDFETGSNACDDGLSCTVNDTLFNGVCAGTPIGDIQLHVELPPPIIAGPLARCISFTFFSDCLSEPIACSQVIQFGAPLPAGVGIDTLNRGPDCPVGRMIAVIARDALHTLPAVGEMSCSGSDLLVTIEGDDDDSAGLAGGNLDGWDFDTSALDANAVNILDFAVFYSQASVGTAYASGDTDCATAGPHTDINGDGLVNFTDFGAVMNNFLLSSDDAVCSLDALNALMAPESLGSISVVELFDRGKGYLAVADLNDDGVLDGKDIKAYRKSVLPMAPSRVSDGVEVGRRARLGGRKKR